ncbi:hypothetical protein CYMTET_24208, partial [Cymbomonas tetramitiformis]
MNLPQIAVVGFNEVDTCKFVAKLINEGTELVREEISATTKRWSLTTKYYTADVEVQSLTINKGATSHEAVWTSQPEAVILVFDHSSEECFRSLTSWATAHTELIESAEIRLCIANNLGQATSPDPRPGRWEDEPVMKECWNWCGEELFEPIEISSVNDAYDKELAELEEPQGIRRARDALHAHLWPNLTRLPPQRPDLHTTIGAAEDTLLKKSESDPILEMGEKIELSADTVTEKYQPPEDVEHDHVSSAEEPEIEIPGPKLESESDELEKIMQHLQNMRTGTAGLSDADRRD